MGPLVTATLQGSTVSALSNVLGQYLDARLAGRPFILNLADVLRFFVLHLITAPPNYRWQEFLDRRFPARTSAADHASLPSNSGDLKRETPVLANQQHASSSWWPARSNYRRRRPSGKLNLKNTMIKWFLDCITLGALFNTSAFLTIIGILKGQTWTKITDNLRTETLRIIVAGYRVWPLASIISFSLIPVERRILFFSAIGLGWNIWLTLIAARL